MTSTMETSLASRRGSEQPVFGGPFGNPDVRGLLESFKRCSPWTGGGWNRVGFNEDVRFNRWPGQSWDCKKRGTSTKPAFPWEEASDQRAALADDIINGIVAECLEAFWRAWLAPAAGMSEVSNYAVKLADYIVNTWMVSQLEVQVERCAQYRETYGWVPLYARWEVDLALCYRTVSLNALAGVAREEESMSELLDAITEPTREAEAVELLVKVHAMYSQDQIGRTDLTMPALSAATARRAVAELRQFGVSDMPVPYVCRNQPAIYALKPWEEFFLSNDTSEVERGVCFRVDWLSEVDLRAKEKTEDWDSGWIAEAIKHKGKFSAWNIASSSNSGVPDGNLVTAMAGSGSNLYQLVDQKADMIEVVYAVYRMLDPDGIPGVYLTIMHPAIGGASQRAQVSRASGWAWHGLLRDAAGTMPFLIGKREELAPSITSSRGVPEVCNSWQRIEKSQTDGANDWTSIGVLPPINEYVSALGTQYKYGPAVRNTVQKGREPQFMDVPTKGVPWSFELLDRIERKVSKYFGETHPQLDPQLGQAKRNKAVTTFLQLWTRAIQRVIQLCQVNMADAHFAEVTGAPPGWLDQRRNQPDMLAARLEFDVRELDPEYVALMMKAVNETVIPADVGGVLNRTKWSRVQMRMLSPRLSRELVQEEGDASKAMFERVKSDIQGMALGDEAETVEMDPGAKAKLDYMQKIVDANPNYVETLKQQPKGLFAKLLQEYEKNLQFSLTEEANKQVGRVGVKPGAAANEVTQPT
jgi:hypothetical protein